MKKKIIIIISVCIFAVVSGFFIYHRGKSGSQIVKEYFELLDQKKYTKMYEMLDPKKVYTPSKQDFVERYKNIYEGIEAENIAVKILKEENNEVEYQLSMDTVAGKVKYKNTVAIRNGQIGYNNQLVLDGFSAQSKVKVLTSQPVRGCIYDRHGNALAKQGNGYSVGLVRGKLNGENDYEKIAQFLETDVESIQKKMSASWIKDDSFVPIKTVSEATKNELISQGILNVSGVMINTISIRVYPYDQVTSHLIGYLQKVNADDLKKHEGEDYDENSMIGRSGLEAAFEKQLKGEAGKKIVIVGESGDIQSTVANKETKNGEDLHLTIDIALQQSLYDEYQHDQSASVALNPQTGEILALVSTPSFSNNDFITGLSSQQWQQLNNDETQPMVNRFKAAYTPGSTMKPVTAAIGLDTGTIDENKDLQAKEKWQKDKSWGDYYITTLHAPVPNNLENAIIYSDNVYFARTALVIGKDNLFSYYQKLKIGNDIPFELKLNQSQYINKKQKVTDQLLADSGYGQGQLLMNPVQLSCIYGSFVNEGTIMQPHVVQNDSKIWIKNAFKKETAKTVLKDLTGVIENENGTGHDIYHEGMTLAGKTGTAEIKKTQSDTSGTELGWFTVMTVNQEHPVLVTTMVENVKDRGGSTYVVQHMKSVLNEYLFQS